MLSREKIIHLFERVNSALNQKSEQGEIGIVGGAVMCLVYDSRAATRDVDAIFEPAQIIRKIAADIAEEQGLAPDWLNDAAKSFIQPGFKQQQILSLSNLNVWAPEPRYMLAMKCISARWDSSDRDDVIFLVDLLKIKSAQVVFETIENYYPKNRIPSKTQFFVEELFET